MATLSRRALRAVEGHRVDVVLRDGRRITGCTLVSGGRARVTTLWLVADEDDILVGADDVASMRESTAPSTAA